MFKKLSLVFMVMILISHFVWAMSPAQQQNLSQKLSLLTVSHEGKAGVVFIDLESGWQFSIHGTQEFPAASVVKVAVMATAYHLAETGGLNLEQKIRLKKSDKLGGSGILQWMRPGRYYTLRNLISLMIIRSDNTATKMIIGTIGLDQINNYLQAIGLSQTKIVDSTMLKEPPRSEINLTTPLDMANLWIKIEKREGFSNKSAQQMLYFMKNQRYRWGIWKGVSPGTVVANKTGNLTAILNDVGIVYTKSGNYVLSVFTYGFKKQKEARKLINEISKAVFEEYTGTKVVVPKKASPQKKKLYRRRYSRRLSRRRR